MLSKFLKEVVVLIVGKTGEPIADLLDSNKHVNEFLIAKKLNLTINQTRNMLYKIADHGLVSSIRKKDKRKGWYTYFWKLEPLKSLEFLREVLTKKIDNLKNQIRSRETKNFYYCETCNVEYNEENSLLMDFTCNECGNVFKKMDSSKALKEFKKELDRFEKDRALIDEEINQEKEKFGKKIEKERKKVLEERKLKRQKAMKKRKKDKEKAERKLNKGKIKIKPVKKQIKKSKKIKKNSKKKRR